MLSRRNKRRKTPEQRRNLRQRFVQNWILAPLRIVFLAILGIMLGFGGYRVAVFLHTSTALAVRCIEVLGTVHTDADEIKKCAGLSEGQNIFSIDLEKAKRKIEQHPWIRKATVQRVVPDRMVVEVEEQKAAAAVALDGLYLVNTHGEVFKRMQPGEMVDLVIITGIDREEFGRDHRGAGRKLRESLHVISEVQDAKCLSNRRLAEVHHDDLLGITLVMDPGALVVRMGLKISKERLSTLCVVIDELTDRGMNVDEIMMDETEHPDRAIARLGKVATLQVNTGDRNNRI